MGEVGRRRRVWRRVERVGELSSGCSGCSGGGRMRRRRQTVRTRRRTVDTGCGGQTCQTNIPHTITATTAPHTTRSDARVLLQPQQTGRDLLGVRRVNYVRHCSLCQSASQKQITSTFLPFIPRRCTKYLHRQGHDALPLRLQHQRSTFTLSASLTPTTNEVKQQTLQKYVKFQWVLSNFRRGGAKYKTCMEW